MEIEFAIFVIAVPIGFYCMGRAHQIMKDSSEKIKALKAIKNQRPLTDIKEECKHGERIELHGHPAAFECTTCGNIVKAL